MKNIKLSITIERDLLYAKCEFQILDIVFGDMPKVLDFTPLNDSLKKVLRKIERFDLLTIDLMHSDGNYSKYEVLKSVRYKSDSSKVIERAYMNREMTFKNWSISELKEASNDLKNFVYEVNQMTIEQLKQVAK